MTKAERLLFIVNLFRVRKVVSLNELAEECGVSNRTIYRDLLSLSELNIPVYFDNGYRLAGEISIPPLNFTEDEQEIITFSLKHSPLAKSSHFRDRLKNIELKILSAVPERCRSRSGNLIQCSEEYADSFSEEKNAIIRDFFKALIGRKTVSVKLRSKEKIFNGLCPVSIQIKGKLWRLSMTDILRSKTINVPIEKIESLRITAS